MNLSATFELRTLRRTHSLHFQLPLAPREASLTWALQYSLKLLKKNVSDHAINISRLKRHLPPYQIDVRDEAGNLRPETEEVRRLKDEQVKDSQNGVPFTGSIVFGTLKPGESKIERVDISRVYDMNTPGKYTIEVYQTDPESKTVVRSNVITVTVTP